MMQYTKPRVENYTESAFLAAASCQYTGSLTITFQQTAMLERPGYELQINKAEYSGEGLIKLS